VLGDAARGPEPAAAIAGELEDGEAGGDLAQENGAGERGAGVP
jgi:hypothetical protein